MVDPIAESDHIEDAVRLCPGLLATQSLKSTAVDQQLARRVSIRQRGILRQYPEPPLERVGVENTTTEVKRQ